MKQLTVNMCTVDKTMHSDYSLTQTLRLMASFPWHLGKPAPER